MTYLLNHKGGIMLRICMLVCLLLLSCGPNAIEQAQKQIEKGDFTAAIATLESRLASKPKDRDAWLQIGEAYLCIGNYTEASNAFQKFDGLKGEANKVIQAHQQANQSIKEPMAQAHVLRHAYQYAAKDAQKVAIAKELEEKILKFSRHNPLMKEEARSLLSWLQSIEFSDNRAWYLCTEFPDELGTAFGAYTYLRDFSDGEYTEKAETLLAQGFETPEALLEFIRRVQDSGCRSNERTQLFWLKYMLPPAELLNAWLPNSAPTMSAMWDPLTRTDKLTEICRTRYAKGLNRGSEREVAANKPLALKAFPASLNTTQKLQLMEVQIGIKDAQQGHLSVQDWVLVRDPQAKTGWWALSR